MSKKKAEKEEGKTIMAKFTQQVISDPQTREKLTEPKKMTIDHLPALPKRTFPMTHRRLRTVV